MSEFLHAAAGFPTVLFTAALVVVVGFWLLVLVGGADHDSFEGDVNTDVLGFGGVPVSVSASLCIALVWFLSLTGSVIGARAGAVGTGRTVVGAAVLLAAVVLAWTLTRIAVRPLAKLFPDEPGPSRHDFVGLTCTIRTGRVDAGFGQAEVAAQDGSTAVVQVRQYGAEALALGSTGLLYAYDEDGEFFWVSPYGIELHGLGPYGTEPVPRG
ncbi:hypothetical protein OG897_30650 [Streptomyces sp. NBC_00237]|uniref:hypothetical protein n=1 Tax=Streptomyces sp. NBC_00237 TaxID=2975687 RepID=UPI00224E9F2E|nr:hypothetical protein [Streptomyces sp. NBC_00237]MCX5205796.1 hypothetical protein [Streptomyces sp. NBC_00237]